MVVSRTVKHLHAPVTLLPLVRMSISLLTLPQLILSPFPRIHLKGSMQRHAYSVCSFHTHQGLFLFSKSVILAISMFILYFVACLVFLSFVMIADESNAVFFAPGMISYFVFSSKTVRVSFDDDGDNLLKKRELSF